MKHLFFQQKKSLSSEYEKLPCKINQEVRKNIGLPNKKEDINCLYAEADNEVFIPFSFIQKYFDVSFPSTKEPENRLLLFCSVILLSRNNLLLIIKFRLYIF